MTRSSIFPNQLRRLIRGEGNGLNKGQHRAEVLAICAQKGGVGKTTTAINLAAGLAIRHQKKVLLVDMDGQGHVASALHAELRGTATDRLSNVLLGKRRDIQELALPSAIPGLWFCPSDKDLGAAEGIMAGRIGKEFLLRGAMKYARTHFDVIVIDCPPNLGNLTVNALMASDWLLIPCDMSMLAVEGVDDILDTVELLSDTLNHDVAVLGILKTRYDARNQKVNDAVEERIEGYTRYVLPLRIPVNTTIAQAQLAGTPVGRFDARCAGAVAYDALTDEVVTRLRLR